MPRIIILLFFALGVVGCPEPEGGSPEPISSNPSYEQVNHWCEAGKGGLAHTRSVAAGLARAHVGQRLFGPMADWLAMDETLAQLLKSEESFDYALLRAYADGFTTACAVNATTSAAQATTMRTENGWVIVEPGHDVPELPSGTQEVVIDLRGASADSPLVEIVALAFSGTVNYGQQIVKVFHGFPAQNSDWTHYETETATRTLSFVGTGSANLPLTFWTGPALSPQAARLVGGLRLSGQAAIVGYDVYASVAESTWTGTDTGGLLWRSSQLQMDGVDWADLIEADLETPVPNEDFRGFSEIDLSETNAGDATRPPLADYNRALGEPSAVLNHGTMRAALLVAYGTLDWFYPFFDLVGRGIDAALEDGLDEVKSATGSDRKEMKHILGRFMHSIHDGHGFYSDWASDGWSDGYLDIQIQEIDGAPVIRMSMEDEINAGDTIIAVEGALAASWYAEATSRYSAASDWYRFVLATEELKEVVGTKELMLQNLGGHVRTVVATPTSWVDEPGAPWGGSLRESGWLSDLDEDNIYYVNMAAGVTPDITDTINNFDDYLGADGIILDMRDYPNLDIYEFARNFNPVAFTAPIFGFPTWSGADDFEIVNEIWSFEAGIHVYTGPVVLMVSAKSVSAAECFAQMLAPLSNVTVVGQTSAATNGTITTAWLPGQYEITFTGMRLLNPDGSEFHGIGVVPDEVVHPTPAQFVAGEDPEFQKAIELLSD